MRDEYFDSGRLKARIYYDREESLVGVMPSGEGGYMFSREKINCGRLPKDVPKGYFEAYWDEEQNMVIGDLTKPFPK